MPILYENYSKSAEAKVTATQKPTEMRIYLWNEAVKERMEGKTVYTGTPIIVRVGIFSTIEGIWVTGRTITIYRRINTGAWENIGTVVADPAGPGTFDKKVTLLAAGTHTFYCEFAGDTYYAGCSKAVRAFAR